MLIAGLAIAATSSCTSSERAGGQCTSDLQCVAGKQKCDLVRHECLCTSNDACNTNEVCNLAGRCQLKQDCFTNDDCRTAGASNDICDVTTGRCLALDGKSMQCVLDDQCGFGSYCGNQKCVPGCQENGDCPLGQPCIDHQCVSRPGACNERSYCKYGEMCDLSSYTCRAHRAEQSLCQSCRPTPCFADTDCPGGAKCKKGSNPLTAGQCDVCPDGAFCLVDSSITPTPCQNDRECASGTCLKNSCLSDAQCQGGGQCRGANPVAGIFGGGSVFGECTAGVCGNFYCGTASCDASTDPCPRGYECNQVHIVITPCKTDADCGGEGRVCMIGGENNNTGFCSCATDDDCNQDDPIFGRRKCDFASGVGQCLEGSSCGPSSGLTCAGLR